MNEINRDSLIELVELEKFNIFDKIVNQINDIYDMDETLNNGGKNWDYEYKFRKSGRTLCAIYFKKDVLGFMIIFGKKERDEVEKIRTELSSKILLDYDNAKTFHDGKWVMFELDSYDFFSDIKKLLYIKRKPNKR